VTKSKILRLSIALLTRNVTKGQSTLKFFFQGWLYFWILLFIFEEIQVAWAFWFRLSKMWSYVKFLCLIKFWKSRNNQAGFLKMFSIHDPFYFFLTRQSFCNVTKRNSVKNNFSKIWSEVVLFLRHISSQELTCTPVFVKNGLNEINYAKFVPTNIFSASKNRYR